MSYIYKLIQINWNIGNSKGEMEKMYKNNLMKNFICNQIFS